MGRVIALTRPGSGVMPEAVIIHPQRGCRDIDPEIMFPEPGGPTGLAEARAVCRRCPFDIRDACLTYALETDQRFGVFGGLGPAERRKLKPVDQLAEPAASSTSSAPAPPAQRKSRKHAAPAA